MIVIRRLVDLLDETFTIIPIGTYAPFSECGDTKKPDVIIKHNSSATGINLEIDENCDRSYEESCEYATLRLVPASFLRLMKTAIVRTKNSVSVSIQKR